MSGCVCRSVRADCAVCLSPGVPEPSEEGQLPQSRPASTAQHSTAANHHPASLPGDTAAHQVGDELLTELPAVLCGLRLALCGKKWWCSFMYGAWWAFGQKAKQKWLLGYLMKWCLIITAVKALTVGWDWVCCLSAGLCSWQGSGSRGSLERSCIIPQT